jgi:hypothetical protein
VQNLNIALGLEEAPVSKGRDAGTPALAARMSPGEVCKIVALCQRH